MKWRYTDIYKYFKENNQDFGDVYDKICDLVTKTILAVEDKFVDGINQVPCHRNNAFELFGFDILLDEALKPWLIEVNVGPSMNQDSVIDKMVKIPLLTDMMNLIGVKPIKRTKAEIEDLTRGWPIPGVRIEARSPLTLDQAKSWSDQDYQNLLCADNYSVLFETDEEFQRRGNFVRVFPDPSKPIEYLDMIERPKVNNYLVRRHLELRRLGKNILEEVSRIALQKN